MRLTNELTAEARGGYQGKIPTGYERLENYAARHELDLVKLFVMGAKKQLKFKRWRLGPDCWVLLVAKKTPPPTAAKPDKGRKPCLIEQEFYEYQDVPETGRSEVYDLGRLSNDLGMGTTAECKDWLRKTLGIGANLITDKTNMGPDRYTMLLQIGKTQGFARA